MWIMQCHLVARHYICELYNAILSQGIIYVNYAMPCCLAKHHICELYHAILLFVFLIAFVDNVCIFNCSSCASAIWIGDGKIWSENKVFRADNATCWHLSCWLQIALQRRIQRQMTSPVIRLRCMIKLGRVILLISCICCIAMLSFYLIYTILNAISLVDTSYMRLPSAHLLSIYKSYIWIISCHDVYIDSMYLNYGMPTHFLKT